MYLTTVIDNMHGNRRGCISLSMGDVEMHLAAILENWDCDYTEEEFQSIIKNMRGFANEDSKSYIEVWIKKILPGDTFDL
jgi:hypothetical protein